MSYDKTLVITILDQIQEALLKVQTRSAAIQCADAFSSSPEGLERLDGPCMLLLAAGEALKHLDKLTKGTLFGSYPQVDWKGAMGFRDIVMEAVAFYSAQVPPIQR